MLSATDTIDAVKQKLINDYAFFGYDSDLLYEDELTSISEDVMRIYFYPRIGKIEYLVIAAKDNTDLSEYEENLFWAEVFTICCEFLKAKGAQKGQLSYDSGGRLTVEGYIYQAGNSSGGSVSRGDFSTRFYFDKMYSYWKLAGFDIMALQRTCTIFGDGIGPFGRTVIQ